MEFTEQHAEQIKETNDAMKELAPMIKDHHKTLYGNGQAGLEKDYLKFKTQIKTVLGLISVFFTVLIAIMRWLK